MRLPELEAKSEIIGVNCHGNISDKVYVIGKPFSLADGWLLEFIGMKLFNSFIIS